MIKAMNSNKFAQISIHSSVILFGLSGIFGKWITLSPFIIVLGRVFFAAIVLYLASRILKISLKVNSRKDLFALSLIGIVLSIHWVTFFQSIQISTVAIATLTFSTFPIFTTFIEPYFFKEKIKLIDIIFAALTAIGVAIMIPSLDLSNNFTQGVIYGMIAAITAAIMTVLNRKYVLNYHSVTVSIYQNIAATLVLLPFLFIYFK